jgi:hypothetical protein
MHSKTTQLLGGLLLTVLIAGCRPAETPTPYPEPTRLMALLVGTLTEEAGCWRVTSEDSGTSYLMAWPPDFEVETTPNAVLIVDADNQHVTLPIGARVLIGGGEVHSTIFLSEPVQQALPSHCVGPYWVVGSVGLAEESPAATPSPTLSAQATDTAVFFPKQKGPEGDAIWVMMEARIEGELMEVDGCLRFGVGENDKESVLPIWPPDAVLIPNNGQYQVYDGRTQMTLSLGEETSMGGGEVPLSFAIERTDGPFPEGRCSGPYWLVGEFNSK